MTAYYNEIDRDAAHVLRCLISDGLIAPGDVDERSIKDVQPDDLDGYTQCHFFAGAGLWSVAARLAGWPDNRPLWTGSCPCQPFSAAGKGGGVDDPRHLWPDLFRLTRARRPAVVVGEQVAGAPGYGWFDGVRADLAGEDFTSRVVDIPACSVDAPHVRQRLYWCAVEHSSSHGRVQGVPGAEATRYGRQPAAADQRIDGTVADTGSRRVWGGRSAADPRSSGGSGSEVREQRLRPDAGPSSVAGVDLVDAARIGWGEGRPEYELRGGRSAAAGTDLLGVTQGDAERARLEGQRGHGDGRGGWSGQARSASAPDGRNGSAWAGAEWLLCHDGKARRTESGLCLLVDGMAGRIPAWRLAGNSISPVLASEVLAALMDVLDGSAAA